MDSNNFLHAHGNESNRPVSAGGSGQQRMTDDVQWSFQAGMQSPSHGNADFGHLAYPPPPPYAWDLSSGHRPVTAPTTKTANYNQLLFDGNFNPSRSFASSQMPWPTAENTIAPRRLSNDHPQPFNFESQRRMFSMPEMNMPCLPDEPGTSNSKAASAIRPSTSGPTFPYYMPQNQAHNVYGGAIGRQHTFPQPPHSAHQHYPFSHDPFPIATPPSLRPNTAGGRLMSMPDQSSGLLATVGLLDDGRRPGTGLSSRPDTATSYTSTATPSTATLGDLSMQIAEPGQTATAIGADGRVYQFVGVAAQQKKRARRRFDEIERMYNCNYPGCTKSYGCLNHLNAHVSAQKHGIKRLPSEFKEMRKEWRMRKKANDAKKKQSKNAGSDDEPADPDSFNFEEDESDSPGEQSRLNTAGSTSSAMQSQHEQQPIFAHSAISLTRNDSDPFDYRNPPRPQTAPNGSMPWSRSSNSNVFAFSAPPLPEMYAADPAQYLQFRVPSPTSPFRHNQTGELGVLGLPARRRESLPMANSLDLIPEHATVDDPSNFSPFSRNPVGQSGVTN